MITKIRMVVFVLVGLVNFAPVIGVISAGQLSSMYGVDVNTPDLETLLRHRAVLFGLLGSFLILAAFRQSLQLLAAIAGLVSMISFIVIAYLAGDTGSAINKVVIVDIVASIALAAVLVPMLRDSSNRSPVE